MTQKVDIDTRLYSHPDRYRPYSLDSMLLHEELSMHCARNVSCAAGVGSLVGAWLGSQPNIRITLLSRSGRAANSALLQSLCQTTNAITLLRCDVSFRDEATAAFEDGLPRGVIHAGGVLADGIIASQSAAGVRTVFAPKVRGLDNLLAASASAPLAFCSSFSSVAAFIGSAGQANYAAANSVLDARAAAMQSCGLPGLTVQWGAWASVGMAAQSAAVLARIERSGMGVIKPAAGLQLLHALLSSSVQTAPQVLANPFAWPALLGGKQAVPPVFAEFVPAAPATIVPPPPAPTALEATEAGKETGILYETTWQAVDVVEAWTSVPDDDEDLDKERGDQVLTRARAPGPGGVRMAPRLLRSAAAVQPTDCALMPCPRGALGNLRFMPLHRQRPGHGEVQVTAPQDLQVSRSSTGACIAKPTHNIVSLRPHVPAPACCVLRD